MLGFESQLLMFVKVNLAPVMVLPVRSTLSETPGICLVVIEVELIWTTVALISCCGRSLKG